MRHAVTILGQGVIKTLIFDKGYWDGKTLFKLKMHYGIDFIIPAKANLNVTKRIKKLAQKEDFEKIKPGLEIKYFKQITDAPNYKGELRAIVVKDRNFKKKRKTNQPVYAYLTSLSWDNALAVYQGYKQRWVIENNAIKELCQYWSFEDAHCTRFNAIRAHIMFSVVMFNLHILFKSKYGRRFTEKSIVAKKAPGFVPSCVIVYCGDCFGIFDIKEYTEILSTNNKAPP